MDLSEYKEEKPHFVKRIIWTFINATLFRCIPGSQLRILRNLILRAFGAKIPLGSLVYSSCKIWGPWNLEIGKSSCIGPNTEIYNRALVKLGDNVVISQGSYICTASHDIMDENHSVILRPVYIENRAWVAAQAYVAPGVHIGEGAVIGARAAVFKDVESWTVVGGNPAKFLKQRILKETNKKRM